MNQFNHHAAPEKLLPWLTRDTSLTDHLFALTGEASLQLVSHLWLRSDWWDQYVLSIKQQTLLRREIVMISQKTPCWYARTIAEESTYQAYPEFFARLEHGSLNTLLFKEQLAVRESKVIYSVTKDNLEFYWIKQALSHLHYPATILPLDCELWGRRSRFLIDGQAPFYLIEFFLPGLLDLI